MTGPARGTSTPVGSGGVGFLGALLLAFIVLRLAGVIGWSWWWVVSPAWIPAAVALLLGVFAGVIRLCIGYYDRKCEAQKRAGIASRAAGLAQAREHEHGPRQRWGARPAPVYGNCPVHGTVHEMLAHGGRMCDGWEPADPEPAGH